MSAEAPLRGDDAHGAQTADRADQDSRAVNAEAWANEHGPRSIVRDPDVDVEGPAARLWSIRIPAEGLNAREVVVGQHGPRVYWERPGLALAGAGVAAEITAWGASRFARVQAQAVRLFARATRFDDSRPRLFGGFAFQDDFAPDNTWSVYAPAQFIVPHFQIENTPTGVWLTVNVMADEREPLDEVTLRFAARARLAELRAARAHPLAMPDPAGVRYPLSEASWAGLVTGATDAIRQGDLQKVVLARACEVRFTEPFDAAGTLASLGAQYPECFRFLFEPRARHTFFGATPELLARVRADQLESMALAGSIRRGADAGEDQQLGEALQRDPKERREHALVVDGLRDRLTGWARSVRMADTPDVLALRNIQHLHTPLQAIIPPDGIVPALARLHPTPALGGTPRQAALDFIRRAEPMPRGWYAAPVGWIGPDLDGEFAVAIRSAVAEERRVWLYAGAGIVADSDPDREWHETALKFRPMLSALGA